MISVIVCARSDEALDAVKQNISSTIGVVHEVIGIMNATGEYGLCAAYNLGALRSRYQNLCFVHDDVMLRTPGWGKTVSTILMDDTIGVLGVAGTGLVASAPGPWWRMGDVAPINVTQIDGNGEKELHYDNPLGELLSDVVAVDGLWMCVRKNVWSEHRFDDQNFKGFHYYDIDFCTSIFGRYRNCVTFEITVEHASRGNTDAAWMTASVSYVKKWAKVLPLSTKPADADVVSELTGRLTREFAAKATQVRLPPIIVIQALIHYARITRWSNTSSIMMAKYFLRLLRPALGRAKRFAWPIKST